MKRLGFRAAFLTPDKNAEARTKPSQTTEPQTIYIGSKRMALCVLSNIY